MTKTGGIILTLAVIAVGCGLRYQANRYNEATNSPKVVRTMSKYKSSTRLRKHFNYRESSENKPYPKHISAKHDSIIVSTERQRAYLMRKNKPIYTFYVSTGKNIKGRRTPKGTFRINHYRAKWFYSPREGEGAYNAVGFHDNGLYLFHQTPSFRNGKIKQNIARELGKKGTSYGCIHLSVPDSQWLYRNVPSGLKVIVK